MPTIAIISQKGGAGKTTLALHLAAAAEDAGHTALVIDLDPQATASQWAAWRNDAPPVVIDSAPPRLAAKIEQATGQGAEFIVIDTPPHADSAAACNARPYENVKAHGLPPIAFMRLRCCVAISSD